MLPPRTIGADEPETPKPRERIASSDAARLILKGESGTRRDARGRLRIGFPESLPDDGVILLLDHGHEADLTAILDRVNGIILKMGTPACHMGIIARELGIPAVHGVGAKADGLADGDEVEIQGETGEVVLLHAAER